MSPVFSEGDITRIHEESRMATMAVSLFMALDGVVDPAVDTWHFPYYNDERGKAVERTHDADVMLFGLVT
jgi:hypothetical protein